MKRWTALALALVMALSLAACGKKDDAGTPDSGESETETVETAENQQEEQTPEDTSTETPDETPAPDDVSVANPFTDYATYEEATAAAGFDFGVPEQIGTYSEVAYRVANDLSLFEVIYADGDASLTARKAPGGWNISGDNNQYTVEIAQTLHGVDVTCWGEGDSLFLAMWTMDDYSYSLGSNDSVDRMEFLGYVEDIIALNAD